MKDSHIPKAIAISGLPGTGKGSTTSLVSKALGFPIVSAGNIMRAQAERLGMTLIEFKKATRGDQFFDYWLDTTTRLAIFEKSEGVIVEGRIVAFTVPESVFRVMLAIENDDGTPDHETRYARIAQRDKLSIEDAKKETVYREDHIDERYKMFYGIGNNDLFNKEHYHLTVNTRVKNPEEVAKEILAAYELYQKGEWKQIAKHQSLNIF